MSGLVERLRRLGTRPDCRIAWLAADAIEALQAKLGTAEQELSIWKSVFPDIAPEHVLPDRSLLEAEIVRLKALLAEASEALTPFALAASHQMILAQASFSRAAVVWEKIDAAK